MRDSQFNKSLRASKLPSSATQGQLVGAGKSLAGEKKIRASSPEFFSRPLDFSPPPLTAPG